MLLGIQVRNYFLSQFHNYKVHFCSPIHMGDLELLLEIIVNSAYDTLISWPICKYNFISTISNCRSDVRLIKMKHEMTILFNNFCIQVEIYRAFTTVYRFMSYYKKFFAVKFIAYSLASCQFLLLNVYVCF